MTLFFLAVLAGFLTVLAPCILPILPVVLGTTAGGSKWRPVFVVLGFILSFSIFGAAFATVGSFLGISNEALRVVAVILLILFGSALLFENIYLRLSATVAAKLNQLGAKVSSGSVGKRSAISGLAVGVSLGLIWTPCAGPILGTILTLAATNGDLATTAVLFAAYALGAGLPMLGIAYGGSWIFSKLKIVGARAELLNKIFGVLVILSALAIAFGYDKVLLQSSVLNLYPTQLLNLEQSIVAPDDSELPWQGSMPEFQGIDAWIQSEPLTPADLKGKVVLVDFWTYSCINCIRTFPYLRDWHAKYADKGLVIVGVHTPEFEFEKKYENVVNAARDNGLTYPIAQDNEYKTWRAYKNNYWPASYLFDKNGKLVYAHHGEGNYDVTEGMIQDLLGAEAPMSNLGTVNFAMIKSPETYFGSDRSERAAHFTDGDKDNDGIKEYVTTGLALNRWGFDGEWQIEPEYAVATEAGSRLTFVYNAGVVNFVMAPPMTGPARVAVYIDGTLAATVTVDHDDLYQVYWSEPAEHQVSLKFLDPGIKVYAVTFGA